MNKFMKFFTWSSKRQEPQPDLSVIMGLFGTWVKETLKDQERLKELSVQSDPCPDLDYWTRELRRSLGMLEQTKADDRCISAHLGDTLIRQLRGAALAFEAEAVFRRYLTERIHAIDGTPEERLAADKEYIERMFADMLARGDIPVKDEGKREAEVHP